MGVFLLKTKNTKPVTVFITVVTKINDRHIRFGNFDHQYFTSFNEKEKIIQILLESNIYKDHTNLIKSIKITFDHLIEPNNKLIIPVEKYESLLKSYSQFDKASACMIKRLRKEGWF